VTVVGTAEIVIVPDTAGFAAALDAESDASFGNFKKDAKVAGEDAGANLRTGMRGEAGRLEGDLGELGLASGTALRSGVRDGTAGLEGDLATAGALGGVGLRDAAKDSASGLEGDLADLGGLAGGNLRRGVEEETAKLADDVEKDGSRAGERLSKGVGSGLSKLASLAANTGLPIGGLSSKLDEAGKSMQDTDQKSGSLGESLDHLGGYALLGVAGAAAVVGVAGVKMAEGMQVADAAIKSATGSSMHAATEIGDAFLGTAGKSRFTGKEMAEAFTPVAAQLKETEGHALSASEALKVMSAASDLAEGKNIELGSATQTLTGVMQAFNLKAADAAHVSDVLYSASNATGVSVEAFASQISKMRARLGETAGSVGELSSTIVDLTHQGITGRGAMTALNTGMNTLLKGSTDVTKAAQEQNAAYGELSPQLQALARQYQSGAITSEAFKKETEGLAPGQQTAVAAFTKASTAVQTAQLKYKEMGLTVFDAQGKFVGMGSIIEQLNPKFAKMSQEQQLATAATLFGAGAARQMTAVIDAGPSAYGKATAAVEKHGAAQSAAAAYSKTLKGEEQELGAELSDVATRIGEVLIPVVTKMVGAFAQATGFVLQHKEILIALGALIAGPLTAAITVFTVNKLAAFGQGWMKVGGVVKDFASGVQTAVGNVAAQFRVQEAATTKLAETTSTETEVIGRDLEGVGAAATTTEGEVDTALGSTGVGAVLIGLGFGATELVTHWEKSMQALEKATAFAGNSIINLLNHIIRNFDETIGELTGSIREIEKLHTAKEEESRKGKLPSKREAAENFSEGAGQGGGVESEIYNFFKGKVGAAGAAGIVGNAAMESSFNPNAPGGGLFQTIGGRGVPQGSSVQAQLESAWEEIQERGEVGKLKGAKSPEEAAKIFEENFEKPEGYNAPGEGGTAHSLQREAAASNAATEANTKAVEGNTAAIKPAATIGAGGSSSVASGAEEKAAEAKEKLTEKELKAEEAAKKAALEKEVAGQEKALAEYTSNTLAQEAKHGQVFQSYKAQELAEHKAYIATVIAEEKKGLTTKQAEEKAKSKQEITAQEAGEKERTKLQAAITSGSLAALNKELDQAHQGMLGRLDQELASTHKSELEKLRTELVASWREAEAKQLALQKTADEEQAKKVAEAAEKSENEAREQRQRETEAGAANDRQKAEERAVFAEDVEKARLAEIQKQSAIEGDKASMQAQEITDATKVMLDKQAEAGLSGTAEIEAHLQTVQDEVTAQMDAAISDAKLAQDEQAGRGAVAEAEAAARTSRVEDEAKVREAQAQRENEIARAQANQPSAGGDVNIENIILNAAGMSAADVLNEVAWSLKTGQLPAAQPTA
jgi:hypothetical protein